MSLAFHLTLGSPGPVAPLELSPITGGLAVIAVLTLLLVGLYVAAYPRVADRLGIDEDDDSLATFRARDGVVVDEAAGTVTLPGGITLEGDESDAVAAAYDHLERRPAATREEVIRVCYRRHPAGYDDPDEWWSSLVSPAVDALVTAEEGTGDPDGRPFERSYRRSNP